VRSKQLATLLCLVYLCQPLCGQKNYFSLVTGVGPSYFFNDHLPDRQVDRSWLVGLNYVFYNKGQAIGLNPGVHLQTTTYRAQVQPQRFVYLKHRAINIHLDMLLKLSKRTSLRAGIFFNSLVGYSIDIIDKRLNGSQYYAWSNDSVYRNYHGRDLQAGITLGMCFRFRMFHRENRLGLQVNHFATPLVHSDYRLSKNVAGETTTVVSAKARPTMLLLTLELGYRQKEKKKSEEEED
jgi:hypothetical protein